MKISIIPNDLTMDLEAVFKMCVEEQIKYVELGYMWNKSILDLNEEEISKVKNLLNEYNIKVASIQTQIMKVFPPGSVLSRFGSKHMHFDYEFNKSHFDKAVELAKIFNAPYIVTYSFFRRGVKISEALWDRLFNDYEGFLPKLKVADKSVVVECEPDTLIATVSDYLKFFNHFKSPHIQANFDMANLFGAQNHFDKEEFEQLYKYVPYFHVKDRRKAFLFRTKGAIFGEGFIPWRQVLPWFAEKGFNGFLSIEPHVHGEDRFEKGRQCAKNLQNLLMELKIPFE